MREIGGFHDLGNADAIETLLAQQRTRHRDDAFAVFGRLLSTDTHALFPSSHRLTNYMMPVIYIQ
ncbi:hypothetical protein MXD81_33650 [Microbacteriaceae bacterium K1510]|nr:hypothetical protein [Microbacteriaceae bacterium K1510]